ncbi:alpha-galactosidase [Streptomyces sp. NPDC005904]|uniref:alpha-galactosidase n=1 Tax=Streptomyces sp. NPDC005904 TaxID=3154570 RepID=UPI003403B7D1
MTHPPVSFDPATGLGLLRTTHSLYALRVGQDGSPRHVYWGAPLTGSEVAALPEAQPPTGSSFDADAAPDELGIQTGARFGPAGLQVRFSDGVRGAQWRFDGHGVEDDGTLRIHLADRVYPLAAALCYRVRGDTDVIERWTEVTHTGTDAADDHQGGPGRGPLAVERCDSASWTLPHRADYRLSHLVGGWSSEFQLRRDRLPVAETVLTSRRGVTSHQANPWLALDDGTADEERGEVWSTALYWSGSWRITLSRDPVGRTTWSGGLGHEGVSWTLEPGQRLCTPVFAGLYSPSGFGAASRSWHRHIRSHVLPRPDEDRPVLYNSWEATAFDVSESGQRELATIAADLGAELFVLDDGWFGARRNDRAGLGDWTPSPDVFPRGLRPLADEVRRLGMRFGLWVEPEMVNADSDLYREHPEWVVHAPTRQATELRNQLMLNLGRPDAAEWVLRTLDGLVREYGVDYLKWDANRVVTEAGWSGHRDPDRLWIDHTRAVYAIMDRLRGDHPGLRVEACAGGGGRADLGVLARTDEIWTSDNTDPVDRLGIQHGFSQLFPAQAMSAWVTDSPNAITGRATPLRFRFHVAMAGALGLGGDLTALTDREKAETAALVAEYKEIRGLVQHGDQYRLTGEGGVRGVHYAARDGSEHVVIACRPTSRFGRPPVPLVLPGLRADARYEEPAGEMVHDGALLTTRGLDLGLPGGDYASRVIRLRRL